ncbi:MAG: MBL fold metallo-hydrolase [Clostridiales bacterium]|nr:MBL fold metallo-hydrolase [Clostridiales bacterium]
MEYFSHRQLNDHVWLIQEHYAEDSSLVMGLIVGTRKAALIDSGMGVFGPGVYEEVKKLTDKPALCICTHGHPDHIAGSVLFDEVYLNERDLDQVGRLAPEKRLFDTGMFSHGDEEVLAYAREHILDCSSFHSKNVDEGDSFDLGGITLEIFKLPGHSKGEIAVYDRLDNLVFSGDAFSAHVPASSLKSLEEFQEMADGIERFLRVIHADTAVYHGHTTEPVSHQLMLDELQAAREIAEGKTNADTDEYNPISPVPYQKKHTAGLAAITYNPAILS